MAHHEKLQSFLRGISGYCESLAEEAEAATRERKAKTDASAREFALLLEKLNNASRGKAFPEPSQAARSSADHQPNSLNTPHRPAAQPLQATCSTPSTNSSSFRDSDMRALSAGAGGGTGPAPPPRSSRPPPTPGVPHGDRAAAVPMSSLRGNDCSSARRNRLAKDLPLVGAASDAEAEAIALAAEVASAGRDSWLRTASGGADATVGAGWQRGGSAGGAHGGAARETSAAARLQQAFDSVGNTVGRAEQTEDASGGVLDEDGDVWPHPPPQPSSNPPPPARSWQTEEALRAALEKFQALGLPADDTVDTIVESPDGIHLLNQGDETALRQRLLQLVNTGSC